MSNVLSACLFTDLRCKHSAMAPETSAKMAVHATAASAERTSSNLRGQPPGRYSATVMVISSGRPSPSKPQAFHRRASAGSFAASKV